MTKFILCLLVICGYYTVQAVPGIDTIKFYVPDKCEPILLRVKQEEKKHVLEVQHFNEALVPGKTVSFSLEIDTSKKYIYLGNDAESFARELPLLVYNEITRIGDSNINASNDSLRNLVYVHYSPVDVFLNEHLKQKKESFIYPIIKKTATAELPWSVIITIAIIAVLAVVIGFQYSKFRKQRNSAIPANEEENTEVTKAANVKKAPTAAKNTPKQQPQASKQDKRTEDNMPGADPGKEDLRKKVQQQAKEIARLKQDLINADNDYQRLFDEKQKTLREKGSTDLLNAELQKRLDVEKQMVDKEIEKASVLLKEKIDDLEKKLEVFADEKTTVARENEALASRSSKAEQELERFVLSAQSDNIYFTKACEQIIFPFKRYFDSKEPGYPDDRNAQRTLVRTVLLMAFHYYSFSLYKAGYPEEADKDNVNFLLNSGPGSIQPLHGTAISNHPSLADGTSYLAMYVAELLRQYDIESLNVNIRGFIVQKPSGHE